MWKYKLCTGDTGTQVCNAPCIVKKIIFYHTVAATAEIYNEKTSIKSTGKRVWTLHSTAAIPQDAIDFGIQGADFYEGCYIDHTLGEVLVVYKH